VNLSQEELGKLIGVSKVSISNWERGIKFPSTDNLIMLSKTLNTSLDYLIGSDYYVEDADNKSYGITMAKEEIEIVRELKNNPKLYNMMISDPKRTIDLINRKIL